MNKGNSPQAPGGSRPRRTGGAAAAGVSSKALDTVRKPGALVPTEDESADPVGDGHSDAELAARMAPRPAHSRQQD